MRRPRLLYDIAGTSVIEFGPSLPLLIPLFVGGFQLNDAIAAYRKLTVTTRTIVDLTSQFTIVDNTRLNSIMNASKQVMAPYSTTDTTMIINQVKIDANRVAPIDWSIARNTATLRPRSEYNLAINVRQPETYILVARMTYLYKPLFASKLLGSIPMTETIIMSPRASDRVTKPWKFVPTASVHWRGASSATNAAPR
ncbi:TadE/TadG family type IV pilus assembly protein [Sphingomonas phyllosphaerae]|uniref:TadE/TadG family type IV pilus assembly protein n=1 Tax=Sphingomonas phyllosphaerae TaxID=257003 RepID=UPI0003B38A0E|nr:TadE/TadG family type IV pilus assembly protein [Sphingomonas phyllosphaerae]